MAENKMRDGGCRAGDYLSANAYQRKLSGSFGFIWQRLSPVASLDTFQLHA
jgi:hypothetical protein